MILNIITLLFLFNPLIVESATIIPIRNPLEGKH